jgi:uncharacterized membrane protein
MPETPTGRLLYIDWMRGLACVLMFQTHCYDAWLSDSARQGSLFGWSRFAGTLPAPLFLFLAGVSTALMTGKFRDRGVADAQIAKTTAVRGAEIFGLGLLFRLQEFLLGQPGAPWTDLLRVDVLNIIGLSMMLMAGMCYLARGDRRGAKRGSKHDEMRGALAAAAVALGIALLTPPMWSAWRPRFLPWYLESYINGVHTFDAPQPWLFPIFPWTAFAFAGLAAGFVVTSDWARRREDSAMLALGAGGVALAIAAWGLDALPLRVYPTYDFWHTSPNFFLIRVGVVLLLMTCAYAWCRWGAGQRGFSPLVQLGKTTLLVYWVHLPFVYGRFSILPQRAMSVNMASFGLLIIFVAMLLLSLARTNLRGQGRSLANKGKSWALQLRRRLAH